MIKASPQRERRYDMGKKKRLQPGGKKLNYTLYISEDDKKKISARAEELECAESYYVVTLCDIDSQLGLIEHLTAGGLIQLVPLGQEPVDTSASREPPKVERQVIQPGQMPVPPDVSDVEKEFIEQEFKDNIARSKEQGTFRNTPLSREELNPSPVPQQQIYPPPQRPPMRHIQDLVANNNASPLGQTFVPPVLPNMEIAHREVRKDQTGASETAFRKKILENLPPVKEEE